jgi:predicted Zn-dependent protease with MMP-like domain
VPPYLRCLHDRGRRQFQGALDIHGALEHYRDTRPLWAPNAGLRCPAWLLRNFPFCHASHACASQLDRVLATFRTHELFQLHESRLGIFPAGLLAEFERLERWLLRSRTSAEVLDDLPEEFRELLERTPVVVSSRGHEHHAYGHYVGGTIASDIYPDRIVIYQDTLERDFGHHPELLRAQVERTVRHELGHHLGWDERRVRSLGL